MRERACALIDVEQQWGGLCLSEGGVYDRQGSLRLEMNYEWGQTITALTVSVWGFEGGANQSLAENRNRSRGLEVASRPCGRVTGAWAARSLSFSLSEFVATDQQKQHPPHDVQDELSTSPSLSLGWKRGIKSGLSSWLAAVVVIWVASSIVVCSIVLIHCCPQSWNHFVCRHIPLFYSCLYTYTSRTRTLSTHIHKKLFLGHEFKSRHHSLGTNTHCKIGYR